MTSLAMSEQPSQRRLVRLWAVIRNGLPSIGRYRRYGAAMLPMLAAIWLATAAYLLFMPPSYRSEFTLILPGSGMGSSLNLESIGQAQTSATSAFSSPSLSPTENYKQLLMADVTLRAAAVLAGEDPESFPMPTVRLVDQTNLIRVEVHGRTPEQARRRGQALSKAFLDQLEQLRMDEAATRETSDQRHLRELELKVQESQRRLIQFQAEHGLATMDQFNNRIASVDTLHDRERELRIQESQQRGKSRRLSGSLAASPATANAAMRLRGDPLFQQLLTRFSDLSAQTSQMQGTLGPRHSALAQVQAERDEVRTSMVQRGRELTGMSDGQIMSMVDLQLSDGRSNLMQEMTVSDAEAAGSGAALSTVRGDLARAQAQAPGLISQASQLADLQRDHRVAEAVFSSALAKMDTNKLDPFASYPLVQTLAPPSLPRLKASPSPKIALSGALAASLLILIAFALLWLRQPILDKILRKP